MRKMKDSGYSWIGLIPFNWTLLRGRYLFVQKNDRGNINCLQLLSPTQKYGVIPQSLYDEISGMNAVKLSENVNLNELKTIHKGAFCISLRSFQGGFEYSEYEGVVSPAYQVFYPVKLIDDRYFRYLFKMPAFIDKMNSYTMSLRDGKNIAFADFANTYIPIPPVDEQKCIANYLDTKCAELDALSADIQKEIETLQEYRKSVITEAVTKGLNPNVDMTESGIDWIGSIPTHWHIERLKDDFIFSKGLSITKEDLIDEGLPVISYGQIHSKENINPNINDSFVRFVDPKFSIYRQSKVVFGNFVFADTSEDYEGCGNNVLNSNYPNIYAGYHTIIAKARKNSNNNSYLWYQFLTDCWRTQIRTRVGGIKVFSITQKVLMSTQILCPTLKEQNEIVSFLDSKSSEIDSIIADKQKQLETLVEYRKSLIYEYVTGKKEVPAV